MKKTANWIISLTTAAAILLLGVLCIQYYHGHRMRDAALQEMLERAKPVERELDAARRELEERRSALAASKAEPVIVIGYQIVQRSDIEYALSQAEQYHFVPVFVLDPTQRDWRDLVQALRDVPCEIVVSASPCTQETVSAATLRTALAGEDRSCSDSGCFLLRNADDTPENLALVAEAGYAGCIRHADAAENEVLDSGLVTLSYSQIKSGGFSVENRLQKAVAAGQALLLVFDMDAMRDGTLTAEDVTTALDAVAEVWTEQEMTAGTVAGAMEAVRRYAETCAMSQAEFEVYAAAQQEKIDALESELEAIRAEWNKGA